MRPSGAQMMRLCIGHSVGSVGLRTWLGLPAIVVLLTVAVVLSADPSAPSSPTPGDEPEAQSASASDDEEAVEDEWDTFAVDVTDLCEVTLRGRLRRTTDGQYVVGVSVKNISESAIPGPILLTPKELGIEGFIAADLDGYLVADEGYYELLPEEGRLEAGAATPLRQVRFAFADAKRDQRLTPEQLRDFDPTWEVRRDKPEPVGSRQPSPDDLRKFAGKSYTYDELRRVMAVQDRWTPRLMAHPEVFGTATSEDRDGRLIVQVFAPRAGVARALPATIDGIPVEVRVMGHIYAGPIGPQPAQEAEALNLEPVPEGAQADPNNSQQTGPKERIRPCSIGSSTSNIDDVCLSGTLGFVGRNAGGSKFLVSNFHVLTDLTSPVGDGVLQPSRGDNGCATSQSDIVGNVSAFAPISFSGSNNVVDCAAATMGTSNGVDAVDASTPGDGYGFPQTTVATPLVGDTVQKYGRTTRLTRGNVFAVNATVNVNYGDGRIARFVRQIGVQDDGQAFSRGGDSGSLIVDLQRRPVGLLFAGGGTSTFANPIGDVLSQFALTVVGDSSAPPPPVVDPKTASVGDLVWLDANGNGVKDSNERGIKNVTVRLISAGENGIIGGDDIQIGSTRTNSAGRYTFSRLAAGPYYLQFTVPARHTATTQDAASDDSDSDIDASGRTAVFQLDIAQSDLSRDAGFVKANAAKRRR
jgi:hypothetical protein